MERRPPDPLAGFKGSYLNLRGGAGEGKKGRGGDERGGGRKGNGEVVSWLLGEWTLLL